MNKEMKEKAFEKLLELEKMANTKTYDGRDYFEQANGAYEMLRVLGLGVEYIRWSINKMEA